MTSPPEDWWQYLLRWASGTWVWLVTSPLLLLAIAQLLSGQENKFLFAIGAYIAFVLAGYAVGKKRPRTALGLLGAGVGVSAFFLSGFSPLLTLVLMAAALGGGWMFWGDGALVPKAPPPAPYVVPADPVLTKAQADLVRVEACVRRVKSDIALRLYGIVSEARGILEEAGKGPADLARARRFLVVHVAGLATIAERTAEGNAPDNLIPLLDELHGAASQLHQRLHDADREAVEIQVEVLSRRLKEEGLA